MNETNLNVNINRNTHGNLREGRILQKAGEEGGIGGVVFREREGLWDHKWSRGAVQDNIYEQWRHIIVGKGDDSGEGEERRRESKFAIGGGGEGGTKAMIINSYGRN